MKLSELRESVATRPFVIVNKKTNTVVKRGFTDSSAASTWASKNNLDKDHVVSHVSRLQEKAGPRDAEQFMPGEKDEWEKAARGALIRHHDDGSMTSHDHFDKRIGEYHPDVGGWHK